jgi:glycosyltransferase involved in cell wall biosynthesis
MSTALISVVIPCFNQAQFLDESIESVRAQTHSSKELIVIDDGSTDSSARVASRYPDVKLVRQSNMGLAAARNSGIKASSGDYLVFLDADDYLEPNALAAGLSCLIKHPECAFAWGRYRIRDAQGEVYEPGWNRDQHNDAYARLLCGNHIAMHATVMYKRDTLELIGGFDARLPACEDYDVYLRITRRFPIVGHENVVAEYRRHGNNMSLDSPMMLAAALRVLESQRAYVDENANYKVAYASGIRFWKHFYGVRCLRKIARELREFRFADAKGDAVSLFRTAGAPTILLNSPVWIVRQLISDRRWIRKR